ncbi:21179_t:CDS:2 [Gigaspora margarita]|uniref:21179_t:CDS:1 n=1 Tax=Gigaspora margarita TaxID=4874 RepID=A0ABN7UKL6_GIGMA|nr:21179_t:CDS:2 [Gigaspora margarita]
MEHHSFAVVLGDDISIGNDTPSTEDHQMVIQRSNGDRLTVNICSTMDLMKVTLKFRKPGASSKGNV